MKPRESKPEEVYRVIEREKGQPVGAYSRPCCMEYDFTTAEEARAANCHGIFEDRKKYRVARYKVTYELMEEDV